MNCNLNLYYAFLKLYGFNIFPIKKVALEICKQMFYNRYRGIFNYKSKS